MHNNIDSGFVYIWFDKKTKKYYIGSHWGLENDGYICSSNWMYVTYNRRPYDFKRRIISRISTNRKDLYEEEQRWLDMIKDEELATKNTTKKSRQNVRYYNFSKSVKNPWYQNDETRKTVGQKISAAKKGKKTGPRDRSVGEAISKAKKESFAKREAELGYKFSPEHVQNMSRSQIGRTHTDEWKQEQSDRIKEQWANGSRAAKSTISEDHKKKISVALTGLKREDVSNYRTAQSKKYLIKMHDGRVIEVNGLKKYALDNNIPYATLSKASQKGYSIAKYGIREICSI